MAGITKWHFICPKCGEECLFLNDVQSALATRSCSFKPNRGRIVTVDCFKTEYRYPVSAHEMYQCPECYVELSEKEIIKGIWKWVNQLPPKKKAKIFADELKK